MDKPWTLKVRDMERAASEIRNLRRSLGLTQWRFAVFMGVRIATVIKWERGLQKPGPAAIRRLEVMSICASASPDVAIRRVLLARIKGRRIVASVSGGKDSAAMSLYLRELGIDHDRVFMDTGWENPRTYEYLNGELQRVLGPITWIQGPRQMEDLIRHKGMFPGRIKRFCTQHLKVFPIARHLRTLMDAGHDVINAVGIRAAESPARAGLPEWEWQEGYDCEVWRPLLRWSEEDVIAIHRRYGLRPNPLYLLGASRVGCWPCIFARKAEVRLIADTDPDRIVRLRVLEEEVGMAARQRAERDGRELTNSPTWFQNPTSSRLPDGRHDGSCWPIDRVVAWSRSAPRGPTLSQDEFLFAAQHDGCMRWGLCDTGGAENSTASET